MDSPVNQVTAGVESQRAIPKSRRKDISTAGEVPLQSTCHDSPMVVATLRCSLSHVLTAWYVSTSLFLMWKSANLYFIYRQ